MRKHPIVSIISALLVLAGVAVIGVSVSHKVEMKASAGKYILPALAFPQPTTNDVAVTVPKTLTLGEYLGTISIPAFRITIPFYQGTEDAELKKGVGHFVGSVLPGVVDNSVLAGHRDSVFSQLGKLKIGDLLLINGITGKFTYKVSKFRIVMANDRTVIVPTKTAVLTLSTCYPFHFFGNAPQRFIVSANLIAKADLAKKV
jgi:sortase A